MRNVDIADILGVTPDKQLCDLLVMRYFDIFDPLYRVTHRPTFEQEYSDFWHDPNSVEIVWVGMLFSILTIALQSYRPGDAPTAYAGREVKTWTGWHKAAEMCLVEGNFMTKGSISIVRALILWLMAETRIPLTGVWMERSWVSVGVIIRIAQSMVGYGSFVKKKKGTLTNFIICRACIVIRSGSIFLLLKLKLDEKFGVLLRRLIFYSQLTKVSR